MQEKYVKYSGPRRYSMKKIYKRTHSISMGEEIKRRLHWLGHVYRMASIKITRVSLKWKEETKQAKKRPGGEL